MPVHRLSESALRFVLESAIRAPSADNRLPIRFQTGGDAIEIHAAEALPRSGGYRELLLLLTLGAVAENAAIAASRSSVGLAVQACAPLQPGAPLLRLVPSQDSVAPDPLHEQLDQRHTNRRVVFRGPALSAAERREIETNVPATADCHLRWIGQSSRALVIREMTRAETERFRNRTLHDELFSAIRFDVGWHASCPEGLPPGALQIELPARPLFALLRRWPVARVANRLGAHHVFGLRSCRLPCRLAPDLGVLTVDRRDVASLVQAGRSFQRTWLELTRMGRVLQPLPAAALYALPEATSEGVPEPLQRRLANAWDREFRGEHPVMFFRAGKAVKPEVITGRRTLETYLDGRAPQRSD